MSSGLMHEIYQGWNVASMLSDVEFLGAGRIVDANVPVRVAGEHKSGDVLGNPFLAWAHLSLMRKDGRELRPGDNLLLWQSVNNADQTCMRTLGLFARLEDEAEARAQEEGRDDRDLKALEFAFIAAALRMLWKFRAPVAQYTAHVLPELAKMGNIQSCDEIWGRGKWKTLPSPPPRSFMSLTMDGHKIGGFLREWHDDIFSKFRAVEAWPVAAGAKDKVPYQSVIDRGAEIRSVLAKPKDSVVVNGNEDWQSITPEELHRLVWTYPRQQLAALLGVTDMAISKRCKKNLLQQPPRGFWQKVKSCNSQQMAFFLLQQDVEAPPWWDLSMSKSRLEELDSVEGVRALISQGESVDP